MSLENLKHNISEEREIVRELLVFSRLLEVKSGKEREMIVKAMSSLAQLLKMINRTVPALVNNISPIKKLGVAEKVLGLVELSYKKEGIGKNVTVNEEDRKKFIRELSISSDFIKKINKNYRPKEISFGEFKKASAYARISNRFFSRISAKLVSRGYFNDLNAHVRKANVPLLLNTYVSMMLFSFALAVIASVLIFVVLIFFRVGIDFPFVFYETLTSQRLLANIITCIAIPLLTVALFYFYPYSESKSIARRIEQELPFVTINMSAIAGSGIEPSQIFKIIAVGYEYPYTKQEIKKVLNQINIYGYDLVNALKNSAKSTSSAKLAELFNGFATTISSGGSLAEFLDKRAETLMFDYRMDKEKATKLAETFMDIYISVVIAAPMIMMILLILINVSNIGTGLSMGALTMIILSVVSLINIVFLAVLQLKQSGY